MTFISVVGSAVGIDEAALLFAGTLDEIEQEKSEQVSMWGVNPEAITELACADWKKKKAPRFEEAAVLACHGHPNPDIWFSDVPEERVEARSICLACPSRLTCDMQTLDEEHGVWAGAARDSKPIELKPDVCAEGHSDWATRKDGRRYCRECKATRKRERRAAGLGVAA